jgi:hypothetical protein
LKIKELRFFCNSFFFSYIPDTYKFAVYRKMKVNQKNCYPQIFLSKIVNAKQKEASNIIPLIYK